MPMCARHFLGWMFIRLPSREDLVLENLALRRNCWPCARDDLAID